MQRGTAISRHETPRRRPDETGRPAPRSRADRARSGHGGRLKGRDGKPMIKAKGPAKLGSHCVERVTRIELALSAWESDRSTPLGPLTSQGRRPGVAVIDR